MLISIVLAATLVVAMTGLTGRVISVKEDTQARNHAIREARFAMQRMISALRHADKLLLPFADNPNTNWRENIREQSFPSAPPEGDSVQASAVLATSLGATVDRNEDGWPDADNDKDARIDEDPGSDQTNDAAAGIAGVDDDGDGLIDEPLDGGGSSISDDDEDGVVDEDPVNGLDDDGDEQADEDAADDRQGDGQPGLAGVDDDEDSIVDEGSPGDDDEDGQVNEDWVDAIVFILRGSTLWERQPDIGGSDGAAFTEYPVAENVTYFSVTRVTGANSIFVDLSLEIALPGADPVMLSTRSRLGGGG